MLESILDEVLKNIEQTAAKEEDKTKLSTIIVIIGCDTKIHPVQFLTLAVN